MLEQKQKQNGPILNAVIGYPLDHTQSPLLHNTLYQALDIPAVLLAFPNPKLKPLIQVIKTLGIELTAVTMPFKQEILKYLDYCSPEVTVLKAANTVIQNNGKLYGYNTDINGIEYALRELVITDKKVLIIGAGGAVRALGYFMQKNKAKIYWLNRTEKKLINIKKIFGGTVLNYNNEKLQENINAMDIIINATPLGMYPYIDVSPLPNIRFNSEQIIFDVIYNPVHTILLKQAEKNKVKKIIFGKDMFIGQGLRQIELWMEQSAFIS